jgi:gluconate 2-dehydrogenase subunit 3-like protein
VGGQGIDRREVLRYLSIASVAGAFPGFSTWAFACPQQHAAPAAPAARPGSYLPLFLTADQYRMVEHLVDLIIPEDETPGAKRAGVTEFIDFMLANRVPVSTGREVRSTADAVEAGDEAQTRFLLGLEWMNARCQSEFARPFMQCTADQQHRLLEELAYKSKFTPGTETGRAFFLMLRDYTVVGYYTTKIGLESLGYPGLQTVWPSMPGCSHPDDPEHVKLQPSSGATSPQAGQQPRC